MNTYDGISSQPMDFQTIKSPELPKPWLCGLVGWGSSHASKGCWFDSWSGHLPMLQAWSMAGIVQKAADEYFSLSLPQKSIKCLFLKISRTELNLQKGFCLSQERDTFIFNRGAEIKTVLSIRQVGGFSHLKNDHLLKKWPLK